MQKTVGPGMDGEGPDRALRVAVGLDKGGWHEKFATALDARMESDPLLSYSLVNLDADGWADALEGAGLVIWKPPYMGPEFSGYMKEKIYFMETVLGLTVVPGFPTVWHFESKAAQTYLFRHLGVGTPGTVVTFDYDDAVRLAGEQQFPVVAKEPSGAGSSHVSLVSGPRDLRRRLDREFSLTLRERARGGGGRVVEILRNLRHGWYRDFLKRKVLGDEPFGVAYWQGFIPGNSSDLRITVIGSRYATGFWRRNRPGDFRASGSGIIDYGTPLPEDAVRACCELSRTMRFDSMAYDILYDGERMVISEMSYGYSDSAVHRVPFHLVLEPDGSLRRVEGCVWPQELWVAWALEKASAAVR